jgi:hypothetical protein
MLLLLLCQRQLPTSWHQAAGQAGQQQMETCWLDQPASQQQQQQKRHECHSRNGLLAL